MPATLHTRGSLLASPNLFSSLLAVLLGAVGAFGQYIPPDALGGEHRGSNVLRENLGQLFGTDKQVRTDVIAYLEGAPLNIYLRDSSRVSFSYMEFHTDSTELDKTYRVDMAFSKAKYTTPVMEIPAPGITNYYQGESALEGVRAYRRAIYSELYHKIDFHMYTSSGGPRMAFVVKPGGNPEDIRLQFTGQDSLGIDWLGSLKAYLEGKWIELKQALAYEVDQNGLMHSVPWTPTWIQDGGNVYASLSFGAYDPDRTLVLLIGYPAMAAAEAAEPRNMEWSTFVGGFGADEFTDVAVDAIGDPYVCGSTWSQEFPVLTGAAEFDPFLEQSAGSLSGVIMRFDSETKALIWGSYFNGVTPQTGETGYPCTNAHKLAVPKGSGGAEDYVFTTGTTNCTDIIAIRNETSVFAHGDNTDYGTEFHRMWVGAFSKTDGTCDWATTHGTTSDEIAEEGLAIAYSRDNGLAVGGRLMS